MRAVVVYESHWGNTATIAHAIAEGLGADTEVFNTDEADARSIADARLIVAGSPVIAFGLPRESSLRQIEADTKGSSPPDVSHPTLRTWLDALPAGRGFGAAFETRIWWSPRGATGSIEAKLRRAKYLRLLKSERFIVAGSYGPLREGELDRARQWGESLAKALAERTPQG